MSDPKVLLKKTSPHHSKRYKPFCVDVQHRDIPPGYMTDTLTPPPKYLPPDWTPYIHPEGALYYHRNSQKGLKVVTTAKHSPEEGKRLEGIERLGEGIGKMLEAISVNVSHSHELYLEYDEVEGSWGYYIIDHSKRSIFWAEPVSTEDISVAATFSLEHLRHGLEEMYWLHVEFYPSHPGIPTGGMVDDILRTLTHAQGDGLTSSDSTFCYSPEKCAQFTKLVKPYRKLPIDGRVLCIVARLNSQIAACKLMNHFGQPHSRLSRDVSILNAKTPHTHWLSSTLSRILFGVPASFVDRLERLVVNDMVYDKQFQEFCANCQEDTRMFINISLGALLMHGSLVATGFGLKFLSPFGLFCGLASLVSGIISYSQRQDVMRYDTLKAYHYLMEHRHDIYGFQYLALLFSLPKAMSLWSTALLVPPIFFILYASIGMIPFSALVFFFMSVTLVYQYKLAANSFHWIRSRNTPEGDSELGSIV